MHMIKARVRKLGASRWSLEHFNQLWDYRCQYRYTGIVPRMMTNVPLQISLSVFSTTFNCFDFVPNMDFDACVELLQARPSHAHHCDPDDTAQPAPALVQENEHAAAAFAELPPAALVTAFFRLQEARAGVYTAFRA